MMSQRTCLINQMRAFCLEYGIAIHQGAGKFNSVTASTTVSVGITRSLGLYVNGQFYKYDSPAIGAFFACCKTQSILSVPAAIQAQ